MSDMSKIINRFAESHAKYLKISLNNNENFLEIKKKKYIKEPSSSTPIQEKVSPRVEVINSIHVGRYNNSHNNIKVGSVVRAETLLGSIKSMGIEHAIKAPFDGIIEEINIEHNGIVEYCQPLFHIKEQI